MSKTRDIDMSISIDAPPEAVWRALSEGEELAKWFAPEARVTPGKGGNIWVSWGGGMEINTPITIFDAPTHLRTGSRENPQEKVPVWVDYTVGSEGGTTTLRLVHCGFSVGADWDEEFDSHVRGWTIFLANLRYYLEQHSGQRCAHHSFMARFPHDRATVWRAVMSAKGLDSSGALERVELGSRCELTLDSGKPIAGAIDVLKPARDLGVALDGLGLLRVSFEVSTKEVVRADGGEATLLYGTVLGYGDHADEAKALGARVSAAIASAMA